MSAEQRKDQQIDAGSNEFSCPIPGSHDKYDEAHYFISQMLKEYHHPSTFRWSLNAFLQALRSVTFMIQRELAHVDGFGSWYGKEQSGMKDDPLLSAFAEGRTLVVHQGMLTPRSQVAVGIFRGRTIQKLVFPGDSNRSSEYLLDVGKEQFIGFLLDAEHGSIDEQIGVWREWVVEELGTEEIIGLCDSAWSRIGGVLAGAHLLVGAKYEHPPEDAHRPVRMDGSYNVLLESDIDPELPDKWGWNFPSQQQQLYIDLDQVREELAERRRATVGEAQSPENEAQTAALESRERELRKAYEQLIGIPPP